MKMCYFAGALIVDMNFQHLRSIRILDITTINYISALTVIMFITRGNFHDKYTIFMYTIYLYIRLNSYFQHFILFLGMELINIKLKTIKKTWFLFKL